MKNIHIILFTIATLSAQITIDSSPISNYHNTNNQVATIDMPEFDVDAMLLEDENSEPGTPFRYGKIFSVNYNLNNSGTWEILDDGSKLWRLEIHSEGAFSIGIEYDYFHLPEGAEFYVYNPNQENIFGAYSHLNNQGDYLFSNPLVKGDVLILEYYEPYDVEFEDGKKQKVNQKIAQAVQNKYNSFRKPADKEKFQAQIAKSYKDMLKTIKSGYGEQKESILEKIDRKIKENKNG